MKNKKAISLIFLSNIISGFAQGISMIAIPWYFVEIADRPQVFASAYILITTISLFWGLYAGTLIDRYSRKKLFILINLASGLIIGAIAIYGFFAQGLTDFLVILVFATTVFNYSIHYPNLYAFGQEITEKRNYGKLNSYIEVQGQTTSVLAGAFAALLLTGTSNNVMHLGGISFTLPFNIHAWSIYEIFLMDAITYLLVIFIFLQIKTAVVEERKIEMGNIFSRLKNGISYLNKHPLLFKFGIASYTLFAFLLVEIHIILPSYVHDYLHAKGDVYASSEMYYSIGAILAGVWVIRIFKKSNSVFGIITLMSIISLVLSVLSVYSSIIYFFVASIILGITNAGVRVLRTTFLFHHIPNHVIGRVNSVFNSINILIRIVLISILALPFFGQGNNIRWGYLIGGILVLLAIFSILSQYKKLLQLEETKH